MKHNTDDCQVEIRWNDRQFILPGHVASKVGIGATRNLVIRRCDPRFTESVPNLLFSTSTKSYIFRVLELSNLHYLRFRSRLLTRTRQGIRDDLEHIHNLVVIKVEFIGGSCYIKTNSVHNAMFARSCMMSRAQV